MLQTTIILSIAAIILLLVNWRKNGKHYEGLRAGIKQMINTAPLILSAFILAGMIEVLIPKEFVQNWLSTEAGVRGIFLGTFGGMIMAMGPYASLPIVASILASGAGLGTVISIITGWCLVSLSKMPFETAFFGAKFYILKTLYSIPLSFVAGFIAHIIDITFF
ncbi:MAG: hypothetical protein GX069_04275 [Tissierellia bacterium]|nr:hypothetical protein [Tissierellia bacterium]